MGTKGKLELPVNYPHITAPEIRMADAAPAGDPGGFRGGFGDRGRGGRGRGRGDRGRGRGRGGRGKEEKDWIPVTKLGRLVKDGKIKSLEEIYLFSLPIKEHEIIDMFIGPALKDEVLRSCLCRSKPGLVREPGLRLSSLLEITMVMLVLVSSAPKKLLLLSVALSSLQSSPSSPSGEVSGVTRLVAHTQYLARLLESAVPFG